MKAPLRVGLDVDGVFANFNGSFNQTLIDASGRHLCPSDFNHDDPATWNWMKAHGYRPSEIEKAWEIVDRDPLWWFRLRPYIGVSGALADLQQLIDHHKVVVTFMTTRSSPSALFQTAEWLQAFGIRRPQVCICANPDSKGLVAKGLNLQMFVDDHVENVQAVWKHHPECRLFLYHRLYNADATCPEALRIRDLSILVDKIKEYAGV